jgi:hypothetical protein
MVYRDTGLSLGMTLLAFDVISDALHQSDPEGDQWVPSHRTSIFQR